MGIVGRYKCESAWDDDPSRVTPNKPPISAGQEFGGWGQIDADRGQGWEPNHKRQLLNVDWRSTVEGLLLTVNRGCPSTIDWEERT
jgi:hypothetical protein